jgi:hypothetical protein
MDGAWTAGTVHENHLAFKMEGRGSEKALLGQGSSGCVTESHAGPVHVVSEILIGKRSYALFTLISASW